MKRHGFTLVELLVVIAIIALLISILLPTLSRAREAAVTVSCLSNIRQIGVASVQFSHDNTGKLFPSFWPSAPEGDRIQDYMQKYIPKAEDLSMWSCGAAIQKFSTQYPMTYGANRGVHVFLGAPTPLDAQKMKKVTQIRRSSEVVSMGDSSLSNSVFTAAGHLDFTDKWTYGLIDDPDHGGDPADTLPFWERNIDIPPYTLRYRHGNNKTANVLFLDSHAENVNRRQLLFKNFATGY